ncbi:PEP-utilizing enzyme [Pseudonocardia sp.]|jgi:hypothetical protein|uniref:PEP-utilizing enzyme n=1 Tax=Pseudonocardia sp. TaxID=60912 RepID=UPI0026325E19|nr:PEP-utilizing enzyme [Pseudonocardia sp.]MCW2717822.1 PEP-utilizing enzyme mobile domain [Pseudonocardia sp.]
MTDAPAAPAEADGATFEPVGTGLNVTEFPEPVEGRIKWLDSPDEVIDFVEETDDIEDYIVIVRGGTTTFLTPALTAGIRGVITLQGAPESHLGIVSREYGIPCLMSVAFSKGVRTSRGETVPADGVRVRLDVSARPNGSISVEAGAPVDDSPAPDGPAGMSPEQLAQIMVLLEKFGGEVPHGDDGDAIMRAGLTTSVLDLDEESVGRTISVTEANELVRYLTWNEWDALAARATEGESGLIPRQEYEALGILNSWLRHPGWLKVVDAAVGIQGVIDIGRRARTEIGTKINLLHSWALAAAPSFGRGIALEMGLHDEDHEAASVVEALSIVRRLYLGHWGGGGMFSSMRSYQAPLLDDSWIARFTKDRIALDDAASRTAFQKFSASTELLGFLHHFDNRLGLGDHGPYPLPDGGFVLVRDLFVNEPSFPWADVSGDLPYAVTMAMFVGPDSGLDVKVTDLSTMFTTPANYAPHISGVAIYTRQHWDTPMDELGVLSLDDAAALRTRVEAVSDALYRRIATMDTKEKVLAGGRVYTAGFALPLARAAGVLDDLVANHGFNDLHPTAEGAYDRIVGGVATEMIPRLFLTGSWGVPLRDDLRV